MALLEAMASGLPVICSDIRGSRDLMGDILSQDDSISRCSGGIMVKKADDAAAYSKAIQKKQMTLLPIVRQYAIC